MNNRKLLSLSMMCSNLLDLSKVLEISKQEMIDYLHIDVMDGEFVPNFGLGVDYIKGLREMTNIPFDMHLMVKNPEYKFKWIGIKENDIVSIHYESTFQVQRALDYLSDFGCKKFLAINPATPIYMIEEVVEFIDGVNVLMVNPGFAGQKIVKSAFKKIEKLFEFLNRIKQNDLIIETDGNITNKNGNILSKMGVNMFVLGTSSVFKGDVDNYSENIRTFRKNIEV